MSSRGNLNIMIAVLLGVVLLMGGGLVYLSNREPTSTTQETVPKVMTAQEAEQAALEPVVPGETSLVVEYTENVTLSSSDRDQIASHVAVPVKEYFAQMGEDKSVQKLLVSNESGNTYNIVVFHADLSTEEYIITKFDEGFTWWRPHCDGECVFSAAFAKKYPQIVEPIQ